MGWSLNSLPFEYKSVMWWGVLMELMVTVTAADGFIDSIIVKTCNLYL